MDNEGDVKNYKMLEGAAVKFLTLEPKLRDEGLEEREERD